MTLTQTIHLFTAGINPESLRGSNTGVFVGACHSEAADCWAADAATTDGLAMIGCQGGMFCNRLSYFFDFKGEESYLLIFDAKHCLWCVQSPEK